MLEGAQDKITVSPVRIEILSSVLAQFVVFSDIQRPVEDGANHINKAVSEAQGLLKLHI